MHYGLYSSQGAIKLPGRFMKRDRPCKEKV